MCKADHDSATQTQGPETWEYFHIQQCEESMR